MRKTDRWTFSLLFWIFKNVSVIKLVRKDGAFKITNSIHPWSINFKELSPNRKIDLEESCPLRLGRNHITPKKYNGIIKEVLKFKVKEQNPRVKKIDKVIKIKAPSFKIEGMKINRGVSIKIQLKDAPENKDMNVKNATGWVRCVSKSQVKWEEYNPGKLVILLYTSRTE